MDYKLVVGEIIEALEDLGTEDRRKKTAHFLSTSQRVIGLSNPDLKELIKAVREQYAGRSEQEWIEFCKELVKQDIFECQVLAYEMIGRDKKILNTLSYEDLNALWGTLDNWASVDHYTVGIYGVLWGKGVVKDHHIDKLLKSDNFWDRRVAVVSTVALNLKSRGGRGDTPRTLSVCQSVVDERKPMIWKALSWALRELSKRDPESVEDFLEEYGSRMSKQVIREVRHKLDHGTKN